MSVINTSDSSTSLQRPTQEKTGAIGVSIVSIAFVLLVLADGPRVTEP